MEIHENNTEHFTDFIRLNEEWITLYFSLEKLDKHLANNPGSIIDNHGYIFSLCKKNNVVGVCALFNDGNGVYELARMAVSPAFQGQGIAKSLLLYSLQKARSLSANKVYLLSNTKLKAAIGLYKKFGFNTIQMGQHPAYSRANIVMEIKAVELNALEL